MDKVRVGVLGVGRGSTMINYCRNSDNAELVAICDISLPKPGDRFDGVTYYDDFDNFLKHDMDAVVLANYANEHAPFAIRSLKAGKHVISEVLPFQTLKEGVELIETIEQTGLVYAYAENYCYMPAPMEMNRLMKAGKLGAFEYAEGEYVHNCEPGWSGLTHGSPDHWRNTMSAAFYCTHSIGPMIHISGKRPVKVSGFEIPFDARMARMGAKAGALAVEMITLEDGAVLKSLHGVGPARNSVWYSVYGSLGRVESARESTGQGINTIFTNLDEREGQNDFENEIKYNPRNEFTEKAKHYGHGSSDFFTMYYFCEKILGRENDSVDIYEACDMFLPGLFAYRSILAGGQPMDVPNFRLKSERDKWRDDTACTDPKVAGDMLQPSFSKGTPAIPDSIYEHHQKVYADAHKA